MSRQHVDYTTSALNPPNAPTDDGLDTGSTDAAAIRPVADGQPAQAAVLKRPSENLRTRTEKIRDELEKLKYLSDADRALLLTSPGDITWNGQGPGAFPLGTFQLSSPNDMTLRSFLAPATSIASRLVICDNTAAMITIRTKQGALVAPRAYSGANDISIDFQPVTPGTGAIVVTVTGEPANNVHVQFDDHVTSGTTVNQINANSFLYQFNNSVVATTLGLEAVIEGGGTPVEVGYPVNPFTVVAAEMIWQHILAPEKATRYMSGAVDAEKHAVAFSQFVTFFADPLNAMIDGDTLCISYDDLVMSPTDGGRRQSIAAPPESNAAVPSGNLFLLRRFPDRLPLALPLCTVADGKLIFISGRVYNSGESGPLVSSGSSYQGSPANPNSWADNTGVAQGGPPISFEAALDTIIQTLGAITNPSGAHKVGIPAISGSPISTTAGGVHGAISSIVTGTNAHIATLAGAGGAAIVGNTAAGNIASATVQAALNELDSEKAGLALANTFTAANTFNDLVTIAAKAVLQPTYLPGGAAHLAEIDIPQYRSLGVPTDSTDVGLYIGNGGLATALKIESLNYGAGIDVEMGLGANTRGLHVHASGASAFQTAYFESGATSFGAVQADNTGDGQAIVARRSAEVSAPTYATAYLEGKRSDPAILVVRPGTTVTTVGGVGIDVTASPGSTRGGNAIKAVAAPAGATPTSNSNGAAINAQSVATAPAIYVGAVQSVGLTPAILGEGSVDATGALMSLENTLAPTTSGVHTLLRVRTNQKATETSVVGLDVYNDDAAHVGIKFSGVANSIPLSFLSHALPAVAPVGGLGVESYTSGVGAPVGRNRLRSYIGSTLSNGTWSGKRVLVPVGATWNTSSTLFYWVDAEGVLHMRGNLIPTSAQNLVYNTLYTVNAGALEQGLWPTATAASMATAAQASGVSIPVQVGIVAGSGDLYLFQKYDNPGPFVTTSVSCISLDYPLFS